MSIYIPKDMPEIEICYAYTRPEVDLVSGRQICPAAVDFLYLTVNGKSVSMEMDAILFELYGEIWKEAIIEMEEKNGKKNNPTYL